MHTVKTTLYIYAHQRAVCTRREITVIVNFCSHDLPTLSSFPLNASKRSSKELNCISTRRHEWIVVSLTRTYPLSKPSRQTSTEKETPQKILYGTSRMNGVSFTLRLSHSAWRSTHVSEGWGLHRRQNGKKAFPTGYPWSILQQMLDEKKCDAWT